MIFTESPGATESGILNEFGVVTTNNFRVEALNFLFIMFAESIVKKVNSFFPSGCKEETVTESVKGTWLSKVKNISLTGFFSSFLMHPAMARENTSINKKLDFIFLLCRLVVLTLELVFFL